MGCWATCEKCKETNRYSTLEIENHGTAWHQIWTVKCANCGHMITMDMGPNPMYDESEIKLKEIDSEQVTEIVLGKSWRDQFEKGEQRAHDSDIRESWIQEYIKENHSKYGIKKIKGPFNHGPDFKGFYKGKWIMIEVERDCSCYTKHQHHLSDTFDNCKLLIVLNPKEPSDLLREKLPKDIINIDIDDFIRFWEPKEKILAQQDRGSAVFSLIKGDFIRRYLFYCDDKDRDMAICPNCLNCAYYFDGDISFFNITMKFLAYLDQPIISDSFKLSDIEPDILDNFLWSKL